MAKADAHLPTDFADIVVENARDASEKVRFGDLWRDKPLVAVFLRRCVRGHVRNCTSIGSRIVRGRVEMCRWGCQICRVQAQDLETIRSEVDAAGARIVCFGHERFGEASDSDRSFEAGKYYSGPVYVDADKKLYTGLFSRKTLWQGYGLFDMSKERIAQVKERNVPGNFKGDGFQLGGTFVIDTDGSVKLDHRQKYYGDDATNEDILAAVRGCRGTASVAAPPSSATPAAAAATASA